MAKKDENQLKKLSRHGLLNLLLEQTRLSDRLAAENESLKIGLEEAKADTTTSRNILKILRDINNKLDRIIEQQSQPVAFDNDEIIRTLSALEQNLKSTENKLSMPIPSFEPETNYPDTSPLPSSDEIIAAIISQIKD